MGALGNHVVYEQRSGLVAVQEPPPAFGLRIRHGDAHPVRIGIGAQNQLRIDRFGQFDGLGKRRTFFGVGTVDRRKVTIGVPLALHDVHVAESGGIECGYDGDRSCAVQRCVHNAEIAAVCNQILTQSQILDRLPVRLVSLYIQ